MSVSAWSAVPPEIAATPACWNVMFAGLCASLCSSAAAYSAYRAPGDPEHLVAGAQAGDVVAHLDDSSGDIRPGDRTLGLGDPVPGEPNQVGGAGEEVGHASVDAGRVHLDEHLFRRDLWPVDGAQLQHLGRRAIAVLDDCAHGVILAVSGLRGISDGTLASGRERTEPGMDTRRLGRIFGWFFIGTFVTSIPARILFVDGLGASWTDVRFIPGRRSPTRA